MGDIWGREQDKNGSDIVFCRMCDCDALLSMKLGLVSSSAFNARCAKQFFTKNTAIYNPSAHNAIAFEIFPSQKLENNIADVYNIIQKVQERQQGESNEQFVQRYVKSQMKVTSAN